VTSALVSGGKDSVFSASLAEAQGWTVDELVVLVPEDVDSFLYHTPNLGLVALQAEAWGKPLRTVPIPGVGESVESGTLESALSAGRGPVVAGAIASAYQWSRLHRITTRLGRPLYAPLWGKDPGRVVRSEIEAGLDIRLVQVAAEPLTAELLGRRLDLRLLEEIESTGARRSVHPAGEGGEYESLVVETPFWDRRIVIDEERIVKRGLAARLDIGKAHLAPKALRPSVGA
jgi:diphthine-ammonia ligase